jgi:hypothetical protein
MIKINIKIKDDKYLRMKGVYMMHGLNLKSILQVI